LYYAKLVEVNVMSDEKKKEEKGKAEEVAEKSEVVGKALRKVSE
jgi:hypothetical protein